MHVGGRKIRRIWSGTKHHAGPHDVFNELLMKLREKKVVWVYFECCKHTNWFRRIFADYGPSTKIKFIDKGQFKIFLGRPTRHFGIRSIITDPATYCRERGIEIPQTWSVASKGLCLIPELSELQVLVEWLDRYFVEAHGCPSDYQVKCLYRED